MGGDGARGLWGGVDSGLCPTLRELEQGFLLFLDCLEEFVEWLSSHINDVSVLDVDRKLVGESSAEHFVERLLPEN